MRADFRVTNHDIKTIDIWFECHPDRCGDVSVWQSGKELVKYTPHAGNGNVLRINVTSYEDFEIHSSVFVPCEVDGGKDPRTLGIMVRAFVFNTDTEPSMVEMDEVPLIFDSPSMRKVQEKFTKGLITDFVDYASKPFIISTPIKRGALIYMDKAYPRITKQFKDFKISKECELITFTDNPAVEADIHVDEFVSPWKRKYEYANMAAQQAVKIAQSKGWDYFMWVEWDCYIGKDYWFDILWDELLAWPCKPMQAGTPAMASHTLIGNFEFLKQDYIASYLRANKVCLHLVSSRPFFLSINAAMGFYETEAADNYLVKMSVPPLTSFDVLFGMRMFDEYGEDVFKSTAWLPSLYSGWGKQDYTEEQRLEMVNSGLKVAMHQYKVV